MSAVRRDWLAAGVVFLVAFALRAVYLNQIESLPFIESPIVDARSYHEWALAIAGGDWLGDRVFYQAPAYPYLLGVVYRVFGEGGMTAQWTQALLSAISCVFLYVATARVFGRRAGIAAGLLLAGYAPSLFFDGMIQKTSLGLFLTSGVLVLVTGFAARPDARRAAALGVVCGLLALTRENALLFAGVIPLWLFLRARSLGSPLASPIGRSGWLASPAAAAGGFALGLVLVLLPVGARNLAVGDTFAITTSQLGPNFYIGNNPSATGLYAPLMPGRHTPDFEGSDARRAAEWASGRELDAGEVSDYWLARSSEWIRSDPGRFASLFVAKLFYTLNDYEIPDTEDIYVHSEFSSLLSLLHGVLRFGVLLPLACAGMVLAWRQRSAWDAPSLIGTLAALFTLAVALFYVWARYRFPLVPLLTPFAGLALARGFDMATAGEWRGLGVPAAALVVGALVSNLTIFDRQVLGQVAWVNLGNVMVRDGRLQEADDYLARAAAIPHESADLHFHLAALRMKQDRPEDAEHHLRRMLALDPTDFRGHRLLAQLLRARGDKQAANHHARESVRLDPGRKRRGRPGAPLPAPLAEPSAGQTR